MGIPYTESGYNMYDMLSLLQKSVRRGDYEHGGWSCQQLRRQFRSVMWNRMLITSCEDCYGVLTKEIVALREKDMANKDDTHAENAMALLCRAKKSRDACYFACNFVIDSRKPREIKYTPQQADAYQKRMRLLKGDHEYGPDGFSQGSFFDPPEGMTDDWTDLDEYGLGLEIALEHRDMDMMGWCLDQLRRIDWNYIWDVYLDYAQTHDDGKLCDEIIGLKKADGIFNARRQEKNDIFTSKAAMIICYTEDPSIDDPRSSKIVQYDSLIDWSNIKVKPFSQCKLAGGVLPEWVFDCHTLKGKKMGKTDWDMTIDEQAALSPLAKDYFSEASWLYTYEQDYRNGVMTDKDMEPIRKFAETHPANPVEFIPYDA